MYTFDLMRAELLISLANTALQHREKTAGTFNTRGNEVAVSSLEEAKKLILQAKQEKE